MAKASRDIGSLLRVQGLSEPVAEYHFHPSRRWRFDFAWLAPMLALEIEGGAWIGGRHMRPMGFIADLEKYNAALVLGWRVLRVTPQMVHNGQALAWIEQALAQPHHQAPLTTKGEPNDE